MGTVKTNFTQFKAACLLSGLSLALPERKDTTTVWIYGHDDTARDMIHTVADAYKIPFTARSPRFKREGRSVRIAVTAFDHVPLQKHKMERVTITFTDGAQRTYLRRKFV